MIRDPIDFHQSTFWCEHAKLPDGWTQGVRIHVDQQGKISKIESGGSDSDAVKLMGATLPGVPNLHSHAFQVGMGGLVERSSTRKESFWSWRGLMYRMAQTLAPEDLEALTAWAYLRMLKGGFTAVGEFHYIHHGADGRPYNDAGEMSRRVFAAADRVGLRLTHLPVLYAHSDFGGKPPEAEQRRFLHDTDSFLDLIEDLAKETEGHPLRHLGIAPHSLRAVTPQQLKLVVDHVRGRFPAAPMHIHIAEQVKEVEDCVTWSGQRPVEWLLEHMGLDARWCLVHATHLSDSELEHMLGSGAVAGLCPITEANLGDGIFSARRWIDGGGVFGVGTDSNVRIGVTDELSLLEYGQRLSLQQRTVLCDVDASNGATLLAGASVGGAQALGWDVGSLEEGKMADLITLDLSDVAMTHRSGDDWVDSWVFARDDTRVSDAVVGGKHLVSGGRHEQESAIEDAARRALGRCLDHSSSR